MTLERGEECVERGISAYDVVRVVQREVGLVEVAGVILPVDVGHFPRRVGTATVDVDVGCWRLASVARGVAATASDRWRFDPAPVG